MRIEMRCTGFTPRLQWSFPTNLFLVEAELFFVLAMQPRPLFFYGD